jgi:hypothetical protein
MAKAKHYAFDLLFIAPKIGGQELFFSFFWPCMELQAQSLKVQSMAKTKHFVFDLLLIALKVGG